MAASNLLDRGVSHLESALGGHSGPLRETASSVVRMSSSRRSLASSDSLLAKSVDVGVLGIGSFRRLCVVLAGPLNSVDATPVDAVHATFLPVLTA